MAGFIVRQPNGLLCRFSTITDCPTHYNMTDEEYINICRERAALEALEVIERYTRPFSEIKERFYPNNMSQEEFEKILLEMEKPIAECRPNLKQEGSNHDRAENEAD